MADIMKNKKLETYESGILASMKEDAPNLWDALEKAQSNGLIFIDEIHDSITATNRLLLTYPDLHEMINQIVDHWTWKGSDTASSEFSALIEQIGGDN
jgi:hypothetical protein